MQHLLALHIPLVTCIFLIYIKACAYTGKIEVTLKRFHAIKNWRVFIGLAIMGYEPLLYLLTQISFLIGGECVMCHRSKLTNSLEQTKLIISLVKKNNLNFWVAHDQAVHLETTASRPVGLMSKSH